MENNIRTDYYKRKEMGSSLRAAIIEYINDGSKHWLREQTNMEMWDMTIEDADQLIKVADMIDQDPGYHRVPEAFEHACDLDTLVRDVIPLEVWNWMSFVHADKKDHWARLDDGQKYNMLGKDDQGCDKN